MLLISSVAHRILNICFDFFPLHMPREKTTIRYSKLVMSKLRGRQNSSNFCGLLKNFLFNEKLCFRRRKYSIRSMETSWLVKVFSIWRVWWPIMELLEKMLPRRFCPIWILTQWWLPEWFQRLGKVYFWINFWKRNT